MPNSLRSRHESTGDAAPEAYVGPLQHRGIDRLDRLGGILHEYHLAD
jgi:hypothetical protein